MTRICAIHSARSVAMVVALSCVSSLFACQENAAPASNAGSSDTAGGMGGQSVATTKSQSGTTATRADRSSSIATTANRSTSASSSGGTGTLIGSRPTQVSSGGAQTVIGSRATQVSSGGAEILTFPANAGNRAGSGGTDPATFASSGGGTRADAGTSAPSTTTTAGAGGLAGATSAPKKRSFGDLTPSCREILLDNDGRPQVYPALYQQTGNARAQFDAERARLLAAYGLTNADYTITGAPITWAATIEGGLTGNWLRLAGGPISESNTISIAQAFFTEWAILLGYRGVTATADAPYCWNKFCRANLTQVYCGLPIYSREPAYAGNALFLIQSQVEGAYRVLSQFVPMVSLPRNTLVSSAQITAALLGYELTFTCANGERKVQVTDQNEITIPEQLAVHVRTSSTVPDTLEYRMAIPVSVTIGSFGLNWTVYVDGIDGTVLDAVPHFICD